jgi:hypothetical protein
MPNIKTISQQNLIHHIEHFIDNGHIQQIYKSKVCEIFIKMLPFFSEGISRIISKILYNMEIGDHFLAHSLMNAFSKVRKNFLDMDLFY